MSARKLLGRILILVTLQFGALAGLKITPEEIENLMNVMNRTRVVHVVKQDDD